MQHILIIGGGQAGAGAALALRRHGFAGSITLLGQEHEPPYERPQLTKAYLKGDQPFEKLVVLDAARAAAEQIDLLTGVTALAIDRASHSVQTSAGTNLPYDALILATGGRARTASGLEPDGKTVFVIRTRADSDAIRTKLNNAKRLLVVGGGWLGLELAATARALGVAVTVLEGADRLCARAVPPVLSEALLALHLAHGVDVRRAARLVRLDRGEAVRAELADGAMVEADLVVVAIGLVAEDGLAAAAGLAVEDGILTDVAGRTNDPAIFAIGDCSRYHHPFYGRVLRLESWQNANQQAEQAARAIVGLDPAPVEIPWFWSDQFGVNLQMIGRLDTPATGQITRHDSAGHRKGVLFVDLDDRLVGAFAEDAPRDIAMARGLITKGARLDRTKAADAAVPLVKAVG